MIGEWAALGFDFAEFEWDHDKAVANIGKHNISFEEAALVFRGEVVARFEIIEGEGRYLAIGPVGNRLIAVVFAERQDRCRIISARKATKREAGAYRSLLRS